MLRNFIKEFINDPHRGMGFEMPEIRWDFWNYYDDYRAIGASKMKAANHAKKEVMKDIKSLQMELGRGARAKKLIRSLIDLTNNAYLDIDRSKAVPALDLNKHWTRKFETIDF